MLQEIKVVFVFLSRLQKYLQVGWPFKAVSPWRERNALLVGQTSRESARLFLLIVRSQREHKSGLLKSVLNILLRLSKIGNKTLSSFLAQNSM
jgi:hypothetical protein